MGDEIQGLLDQLGGAPGDAALRARAAEALDAAGRRAEALALLVPLVNVTGHDDDAGLPCLCARCAPLAGELAEAAELRFRRSFAISGTRVLHFWAPVELGRAVVRRSVADALTARLARRRRAR